MDTGKADVEAGMNMDVDMTSVSGIGRLSAFENAPNLFDAMLVLLPPPAPAASHTHMLK